MQSDGKKVVHLLDGDDGGKKLRKRLIAAGIDEADIFDLSEIGKEGLLLEDLLSRQAFSKAVNAELERSGVEPRVKPSDIPDINRPRALKVWCRKNGIMKPPNKVAIAYRATELRRDLKLLDTEYKAAVSQLYKRMISRLDPKLSE